MSGSYDFIVVGAGTAGAILAKRLATFPTIPKVALIETGSDHEGSALRRTYDRFSLAFTQPQLDHGYASTPQPRMGNREITMFRGKGLGGTTQTNFQLWSLGPRDEFDAWANAVDDPVWGFDSILESVKKIEKLSIDLPDEWDKYVRPTMNAHGFSGEVDVSIGGQLEPEAKYIIDAGIEAGYQLNTDQNDGDPIGIGLGPATTRRGLRTTSASAYLSQHEVPNLTIITDSQVTKILFDGDKAVGVQTSTGQKILASKEVIISAGAIDTPKLLLLSGIGPRLQLEALGIEVKADLPVGKNLIDHPGVPMTYHMVPGFSSRLEFQNDTEGLQKALQELENGGGPLTRNYSTTPTAFLKQNELYASDEFAGLSEHSQELLTKPTVPSFEFAISGPLIPPNYHFDNPEDSYFNFFVIVMNAQSRGDVTLASADPSDKPVVNPHYLENSYDRLVLKTAVRESLKWMEAPSLKKFVKTAILTPESDSDIDIENFIHATGLGLFHPSCTVRMGHHSDPTACVDHDLRVLGLKGLRVADLSVPPELPSGHPQILAYAIGQIASEKIKAAWNL